MSSRVKTNLNCAYTKVDEIRPNMHHSVHIALNLTDYSTNCPQISVSNN